MKNSKNKGRFIILFFVLFAFPLHSQIKQNKDIERKIDSIISVMTLEEKVGQLIQISGNYEKSVGGRITDEQKQQIREGKVGSVLNVFGAEQTKDIQKIAIKETRLHIPIIFGFDVIHGFRTIFPIPLAEACTWDPELIEKSERIAATEASASGLHWTFAPMVDIARDPRWGRIAEGSGEDTYLGSLLAAAKVRGFQGKDVKAKDAIAACAKHYCAYGGAEGGRDYNTVDISERMLREVYLPPFKSCADAGARTFMGSFNEISGMPSHASKFLMTDILRNEWGFNGFVVSDWNGIRELINHRIAASPEEAALLGINAGIEMDMEAKVYLPEIPGLVKSKKLDIKIVDEAVKRVLRVKFDLGLFDDPFKGCDIAREKKVVFCDEHIQTALKVAERSIVLLKNEKDLLPVRKDIKSLALIGPLADNKSNLLGCWNAVGREAENVTVLEGLKKKVSPSTKILFTKGCDINNDSKSGFGEALDIAKKSDMIVLVLGEESDMSGEAASRSSLDLPGVQKELIKEILAIGKPVVLVLMNGRPLSIQWENEKVPAILETWFLGTQTGNAIANVLFGDYNPSGKLCVSFPRTVGQVPIYYNHKNTGRPADTNDKFTSKYIDIPNSPLYPFGYGLSYTKYEYANLKISSKIIKLNEPIKVSVDIKNIGQRKGEETVQLYIQDEYASVTRPIKELKGFRKVPLDPGQSKTVEFTVTPSDLSFYNKDMRFVVEPGKFKVFIGGNSEEVIEGEFEVN
jgi:beta-glucosidase